MSAAGSSPRRAHLLTVALLLGLTVMGVLAFIATLAQTPGLEGPVELAPAFVVVAVLGTSALPLVWWDDAIGYAAATIAGGTAVGAIALYVVGSFGPPRTAPAAYLFALLGAILVALALVAWRTRPAGTATSPV